MQTTRRHTFKLIGLALAMSAVTLPSLASHGGNENDGDGDGFRFGKVFTSSNAAAGNELLVYDTNAAGPLSLVTRLATNGVGSGGGLGNQGAVTISGNGRFVFVVNAVSNTVSTFSIRRQGLTLESTVDSGGLRPISVTEHEGLVYVLNAAGAGNVAGFRNHGGVLQAVAGSVQPLSAATGTGSAQVGFGAEGESLIVTEKGTNRLTSYRVRADGSIGAPLVTASNGATPFGFAVDRRGNVLVSEAFGGAAGASALSSYAFSDAAPATPMLVSGSVANTQSAACWVVVTPNGRHAYTTNTASGTISLYGVQKSGQLALLQGIAATSGAGPIDAAMAPHGRTLFVLNAGSGSISSFTVGKDGRLGHIGSIGGVPAGSNGLAAN